MLQYGRVGSRVSAILLQSETTNEKGICCSLLATCGVCFMCMLLRLSDCYCVFLKKKKIFDELKTSYVHIYIYIYKLMMASRQRNYGV